MTQHRGGSALLAFSLLAIFLRGTNCTITDQSAGTCPGDAADEAIKFWQSYFDRECMVEWKFVPEQFKEDLRQTRHADLVVEDAPSITCRIETPIAESMILFDISSDPTHPIEQMWIPIPDSEKKVDVVDNVMTIDTNPCNIFGTGVGRYERVGDKMDEIIQQIREDYRESCPTNTDPYPVSIHMDQGSHIHATRTMLEQDGEEGFHFELKLSVAKSPRPVVVAVAAIDEGIPPNDEEYFREAQLERQRYMERKHENAVSPSDPHNATEAPEDTEDAFFAQIRTIGSVLVQRASARAKRNWDSTEELSEGEKKSEKAATLTGKKILDEGLIAEEIRDDAKEVGSRADGHQIGQLTKGGSNANNVRHIPPVYGTWRVLDELTSPPLCCLCNNCEADIARSCHGLEESSPSPAPQPGGPLAINQEKPRGSPTKVNLVGFNEPASAKPPSRGSHTADVSGTGQHRFRKRTESIYGDNFHRTVMPMRTADDHKRVWAQSRALIQQVKAENISVPAAWHFYDDRERAQCWQLPLSQGECGSCWAFASVGALEKQICMRSHGTFVPSLSREHLVRCSDQNNACSGGNADKAYEDMMEFGGVLGTDCIPYQGDGSKHCPTSVYSWFGQENQGQGMSRIDQELLESCTNLQRYSNRPPIGSEWDMPFRMIYEQRWGNQPDMNNISVMRYRKNFEKARTRDRVPSWWLYQQESMKAALIKYGSLYASYRARKDFKSRICKTGCWPPGTVWGEEAEFHESTCGCPSGHAVHIIGYGDDIQEDGVVVPYWLIENSWGPEIHGNVMGEDDAGVKGWGKDPFTEDHPVDKEDECVLAGWADSTLPRTGGCSGSDNVNIRDDINITGGPPDGFGMGISMDGEMKLNISVAADSSQRFMAVFPVPPGTHNITFMMYSKNHPKQQALPLESYHIRATSLRCRGTGYRYSFTKNDTKASLSWGRATRNELKAQADQILRDNGVDPDSKLEGCPSDCRTGSYSLQVPCLGFLMNWGSCYTYEHIYTHPYYMQNKRADCRNCSQADIQNQELAIATQNLPPDVFIQWHNIVMQAFTAPDAPGWMRQFAGSCKLDALGFMANTQLSATYIIHKPFGADGAGACDERHSAPWAPGHFVHAPRFMDNYSDATTRCPMPLAGSVSLHCENAVLTVSNNTCHEHVGPGQLGNREARQFHSSCLGKSYVDCNGTCVWTGGACANSSQGYFKILRGYNYHGIEEGAAFAIAEMDRFIGECPSTGWSRWSMCSATEMCQSGTQRRTRSLAPGYDNSNPICADLLREETRSCVHPGFCPQVLVRFASGATASVDEFMSFYTRGSQTLPYATAGATMLDTAYPTCQEAQYWCHMITGLATCGLYMEGHFTVLEAGDYFFSYQATSGTGELHFNSFGEGKELEPQYKINTEGEMYAWQDTGFHHRRRRTQVKPWVRAHSFTLHRGTYFARLTRTTWSCPDYLLRLERMSSIFASPMIHKLGGNSGQQTWRNDWGAIHPTYIQNRGRYSSYAPLTEVGVANEMLLRTETGGDLIKRVTITKLNFTAEELYTLFEVDKLNPPFIRYQEYEFVVRSTVVLPGNGTYRFKYQQDTTVDDSNSDWRMASRRRQSKVVIRAGGGVQHASIDEWTGSAELDVAYTATEAGTTTFEVSSLMQCDARDHRATLPNYFKVELKKEDMLHGSTLEFGTKTKYMSDIDTLTGDGKVRIDWPDRDDPLSSALRTATFDGLAPSELLIGMDNLTSFAALAEGKIDAGACLALEARVKGHENLTFRGLALELCDVDGHNQYLALNVYNRVNDSNGSSWTRATRVAWVHIGFIQPTHLEIIRDPYDLTRFQFGYRPDDRELMADPFPYGAIRDEMGSFAGEMQVGVSMHTPEAYRYAEFFNISIEPCSSTCDTAAGAQLFCGVVHTPCGNTLNCSATCSAAGDVCHDHQCLACPPLNLSDHSAEAWECGHIIQVCLDHDGKQHQVDRSVGSPAPSSAHHCAENHTWVCQGRSAWEFYSEGMTCGEATNQCGDTVQLFECYYPNDVCIDHACLCQPNTFPDDWDCGWSSDGCGHNYTFGSANIGDANSGHCGDGSVCHEHRCCTPLTVADFDNSWECGSHSDTCGGFVYFQKAISDPYHPRPAPEQYSTSYSTGWAGTEIEAPRDMIIDRLAVGLIKEGGVWQQLTSMRKVSIWNHNGTTELASVMVGPDSTHTDGYAWESLTTSFYVSAGTVIKILVKMQRNDKYSIGFVYSNDRDAYLNEGLANFRNGIRTYSNPPGSGGHSSYYYGFGCVNFGIVSNDGCGTGRWECLANHTCHQPEINGFEVPSGPCEVTDGGMCVQSPNYPGRYGNSENCDITAPPNEPFSAVHFNSEYRYDYLQIGTRKYHGRRRRYGTSQQSHTIVGPNSVSVGDSEIITWRSNSRSTRRGFKICLDVAGLIQSNNTINEYDFSSEPPEPANDEELAEDLAEESRKVAEEENIKMQFEKEERK